MITDFLLPVAEMDIQQCALMLWEELLQAWLRKEYFPTDIHRNLFNRYL